LSGRRGTCDVREAFLSNRSHAVLMVRYKPYLNKYDANAHLQNLSIVSSFMLLYDFLHPIQ
jgi:hypothetical protein